MTGKRSLALSALAVCACVFLLLVSGRPRLAPSSKTVARSSSPVPTGSGPAPLQVYAPPRKAPSTPPPRAQPTAVAVQPPGPTNSVLVAAATKGKDPIGDPVAREALALVGCDEMAEAYWIQAINDPSLSAQERQDLIEDLNEDGLSDPKRPSPEDLPVILNRIALIEWLAPEAMDQVNADAFAEAYKDLANLAQVALGGGEPVR